MTIEDPELVDLVRIKVMDWAAYASKMNRENRENAITDLMSAVAFISKASDSPFSDASIIACMMKCLEMAQEMKLEEIPNLVPKASA